MLSQNLDTLKQNLGTYLIMENLKPGEYYFYTLISDDDKRNCSSRFRLKFKIMFTLIDKKAKLFFLKSKHNHYLLNNGCCTRDWEKHYLLAFTSFSKNA